MPLFGKKFSPKKPTIRKFSEDRSSENLKELTSNDGTINLNLNDYEFSFENGEWIPKFTKSSVNVKANPSLTMKNQELQAENYLLKIKYEIVINMLTEITAENKIMEKELEKLKRNKKREVETR